MPCIDCGGKLHPGALPSSVHCGSDPCPCSCHQRAHNYEDLGAALGRLVETKQKAYGDSFGKAGAVMRILYPAGVAAEQLDDALTIVRILDKLFRVATARDALGESPFRDIGGYALLAQARVERARGGQ